MGDAVAPVDHEEVGVIVTDDVPVCVAVTEGVADGVLVGDPVVVTDELVVRDPEFDGVCVGELDLLEPKDGVCEFEPVLLGVIEQVPATDKPEIEQPS